jgi:methionyl-tRNA formyltransferase
VPLLARCLPAILAGQQVFTPQDATAATFCRRLEKGDGVLDFSAPAAALAARINGLNPWPGCSTTLNNQSVKVGLADTATLASLGPEICNVMRDKFKAPGTVLGADVEGLLVATGQGILRLRRLQRPGGKMLAAGEFLRGFPAAAGSVLPSQPMPPLVAATPFPYRKG